MAMKDFPVIDIAKHLFEIEKVSMECPSTLERCISVADKIKEAKQKNLDSL